MNDECNDGHEQEQVNQSTGNMKDQKPADPQNEKEQSNYKEWSKSHSCLSSNFLIQTTPLCKQRTIGVSPKTIGESYYDIWGKAWDWRALPSTAVNQ
jgi:hypothetical protein